MGEFRQCIVPRAHDNDTVAGAGKLGKARAASLPRLQRRRVLAAPRGAKGDVAEAVCRSLRHPNAPGATYELGGPQVYSYRALIELILRQAQRRRLLLPLPFALWDLLALLSSVLPTPPITRAQVTLMKQDNVVPEAALTLRDLGIEPTALEKVLPSYTF